MTEKSTRLTLKSLGEILDGLCQNKQMFIHTLFMNNFMDYGRGFRDGWMEDGYFDCFYDWYDCGCERPSYELNDYMLKVLSEWKEDYPGKYRKAMQSIKSWICYELTDFSDSVSIGIDKVVADLGMTTDSGKLIRALVPFMKSAMAEIENKDYVKAASVFFSIFNALGRIKRQHEDWFRSDWQSRRGSKMASILESLRRMYCHLRQLEDLPENIALDMDVMLVSTNRHHKLFGDLSFNYCSESEYQDMICSAKDQYEDYSSMNEDTFDELV